MQPPTWYFYRLRDVSNVLLNDFKTLNVCFWPALQHCMYLIMLGCGKEIAFRRIPGRSFEIWMLQVFCAIREWKRTIATMPTRTMLCEDIMRNGRALKRFIRNEWKEASCVCVLAEGCCPEAQFLRNQNVFILYL